MTPSRLFTLAEVQSLTHGEYNALSLADKIAFNTAWDAAAIELNTVYLDPDYAPIGSYRRFQYGE